GEVGGNHESRLEGARRGVAAHLDHWAFANRRRRDCLELGVVCSRNSERSFKSFGRERRGVCFRVAPTIEDERTAKVQRTLYVPRLLATDYTGLLRIRLRLLLNALQL